MRNEPARKLSVARPVRAASILIVLSALIVLVGCQGLSESRSSQPPSSTLVLGAGTLIFGNVAPGTSKTIALTATNSGTKSLTISGASFSTKFFVLASPTLPLSLAAGQSATLTISFTPNAAATFNATLTLSSDASNAAVTVSLSGTGVSGDALSGNPSSLAFGNVNVGSSNTLSETITNTGTSSISVTQVGIGGTGLSVSGITTPLTLSSGQSATFTVSFAPTSPGTVSANLTITSTAINSTLTIPVSGTAVTTGGAQLSVSPPTLALGNVTVGSSGTATGTLTATGASVTVTGASTNNSEFTIGSFSLPHTIAAGQSASFAITFSPTTSGAATATLTFTSNAQPSTTTETLTGTGVSAGTHSVSLSWTASTSQNVSGYNIYRALYTTSCGTFRKINGALNAGTVYTDANVTNGSSYCYATTAVNTSNEESGYSNIVSNVQIP